MRDRGYARPVESPTVTARSEHDKFRRGPELGGRGSIIAKLDLEAATNPCPEEPQPSGAPRRPALSLADGRPGKRLAGVLRDAPCGAPQPRSWPGRGRENAMLRQIWNAYRGWAKAARDLQSQTQRWNLAALICVIAAAVFGAIASVAPTTLSAWVAGAAAVASAVGAYLGRQIVGAGEEAGWIQARATAEGIKSECYRYSARAGGYAVADADAAKALAANTAAIAKQATAKGLVRADNPVPQSGGDKREPPVPMTKDWYVASRIQDQIDYYRDARARNQAAAGQLWWVAFAAGLAAVAFGAAGIASAPRFAPWIGAMTTIAAAIAAYGLIDRRKYLIGSYAAMQSSLEQILGLDTATQMSLADLVTTTEDLLDSEHKAWLPQMLGMQHQPPQAGQQPQQQGQ